MKDNLRCNKGFSSTLFIFEVRPDQVDLEGNIIFSIKLLTTLVAARR